MFNSDTDSDVETYQKSSTPINTVAEIRREQDKEYMASLEADQKKNEERKKKNHLKEKQELRLRTLKPEPSLRENCLPVIVQHIFLEKKQRLFLVSETMAMVYIWIGSLAPEPELFHLQIGVPSRMLDPTEPVIVAQNNILYMKEVENSDFTFDIFINPSLTSANNSANHSSSILTQRIPSSTVTRPPQSAISQSPQSTISRPSQSTITRPPQQSTTSSWLPLSSSESSTFDNYSVAATQFSAINQLPSC